MYFLVRRLTGGANSEAIDTEYSGDRLVLGSSDAAGVALPNLPGDLTFSPDKSGGCSVSARGVRLTVDGKETTKAKLSIGDSASAPNYSLTIIAPPSGFDLALQLEGELPVSDAVRQAAKIQDRPPISLRAVSWVFALAVLLLALVVPLAGVFSPQVQETLRTTALPDDNFWSSGPLHSAHVTAGVGEACEACHVKPFVMVEDETCLSCHGQLHEHADLDLHPAELFAGERCASCHREHNEPAQLARRDAALCVACHAEPGQWAAGEFGAMRSVSGFGEDSHPDFRVALWVPDGPAGAHGWSLERSPEPISSLSEQSNLKFNHEVHLDVDKVQLQQSGEGLECASCHVLEDAGEHFEPVSMDNHCRSCHSLSFDIFEPELELPHGDLRAAIVAMEAHFIREFTDPLLRQQRAAEKPRRVPGKREAAATCEGSGLDCGRAEALKEAQYQLAETGCVTCHIVEETGLEDISDRWVIHPVKVSTDWYVQSKFDHISHMSQASDDPDALCGDCHNAQVSEQSTDILMPGRDNCLQCHADNIAAVKTDCVGCHEFHRSDGTPVMTARLR